MKSSRVFLASLAIVFALSPLSFVRAQVDSAELTDKAKDVGTSVFGTVAGYGKKIFGGLEKYRVKWEAIAKKKHEQYSDKKPTPDQKTPQFSGALAFFWAAMIIFCGKVLVFYGTIIIITYLVFRHFWSSAV